MTREGREQRDAGDDGGRLEVGMGLEIAVNRFAEAPLALLFLRPGVKHSAPPVAADVGEPLLGCLRVGDA